MAFLIESNLNASAHDAPALTSSAGAWFDFAVFTATSGFPSSRAF